jgi:hypothetical protein
MRFGESMKGQNALEYLVTHVWMLLILVVVIAAIFSLGIFSSTNLAPRAQSGSCLVQRPYGPGRISLISLTGECGPMLPKFVASFNGGSSYISTISNSLFPTSAGSRTITAWFKMGVPTSSYMEVFFYGTQAGNNGFYAGYNYPAGSTFCIGNWGGGDTPCKTATQGVWHMISASYNTTTGMDTISIDGNSVSASRTVYTTSSTPLYIGDASANSNFFIGDIANVQMYNVALSANAVSSLYVEGIGGAPINLANLVGWWPLNGNANDYSGDNETGLATNVIYTTQWTTGYTPT